MNASGGLPFRFRPRPLPTLAALLLAFLFGSLGVWQLRRAGQSEATHAAWLAAGRRSPMELFADWQGDPHMLEYRRLLVRGEYRPERQVLLDNVVHEGRPGVDVLTPLKLSGSEREVLVDRGWVPMGPGREVHADWRAPGGLQRVSGRVWIPSRRRFESGGMLKNGLEAPALWLWADLQRYQEMSGRELLPFVIRLDPGQPGGYLRKWPAPRVRTGMHIGYAVQWFAFALITLSLWAWKSTRREGVDD